MLKKNYGLMEARGLNLQEIDCLNQTILDDYQNFIAYLINNGDLPPNPPFEIHPYENEFTLQKYQKYIIGTFPPINYILDIPHVGPLANLTPPWIPFYHGNRGSMWSYLLTNHDYNHLVAIEERIDAKNFLINCLQNQEINYADIIHSCQRSAYNANDAGLNNICINKNLILHILHNNNSQYLLFNTGSPFRSEGLKIHINMHPQEPQGVVNVSKSQAFDLFVRGCQEMGFIVSFRIQQGPTPHFDWTVINLENINIINHLHNKVAFEIKIESNAQHHYFFDARELTVITGPSPSNQALRGIANNANFINWHQANLDAGTADFIRYIYQSFKGDIHLENFYNLNQP